MVDLNSERRIRVPILTRVEGEGGLYVQLDGNEIKECQLNIYEPPRLFETLLIGRSFEDVADITARICGICPIAYQMTAVQALENAMGVKVSPEVERIRRLIYYGEWIESNVLHVHLLQAPDFFDCDSAIELAKRFPNEVKRGLQMKKFGNRLLEVFGGRAIHPINLAVGGFYRLPRFDEMASLLSEFEWGLQAAIETVRWLAALDFPEYDGQYDFVALKHDDEYAIHRGKIAFGADRLIAIDQYEQHFGEEHVAHSTALQSCQLNGRTTYFVGPLARLHWNRDLLSSSAKRIADEIHWSDCHNPYRGIVGRSIEVVHAFEEALNILRSYDPKVPPRATFTVRAGEGCSATEAPRGLIYHRYRVDDAGKVQFAKIVPPTSQNQAQIESDLRRLLPTILQRPDLEVGILCERLVRNYDPCISCSTHFLRVTLDRGDGKPPTVIRA